MSTVRLSASPQFAAKGPKRAPMVYREIVNPVAEINAVDVDRRRSLREELTAAEDRFPVASTNEAAVDAKNVVDELVRLGGEAVHALRAPSRKAMGLIGNADGNHYVDEQA